MRPDHDDEHEEKETPDIRPPAALTDTIRERLFKSRTLVISGEINQQLASHVVGQLLALDGE
jgi:ATP-dependent protease ClpP protease subunit